MSTKVHDFDVLKALFAKNNGSAHAYYGNNIKRLNAGSKGWGDVTVAISTGDAQTLMIGKEMYLILVTVKKNEFDQLKSEMENNPPSEMAQQTPPDLQQQLQDYALKATEDVRIKLGVEIAQTEYWKARYSILENNLKKIESALLTNPITGAESAYAVIRAMEERGEWKKDERFRGETDATQGDAEQQSSAKV